MWVLWSSEHWIHCPTFRVLVKEESKPKENFWEFQDKCRLSENSEEERTKLVTLTWQGSRNPDSSSEVTQLPVPYELPPQPYTSEGHPLYLLSHCCAFRSRIYLTSSSPLCRYPLVLGPALQQERCSWSSMATASTAVFFPRFLTFFVYMLGIPLLCAFSFSSQFCLLWRVKCGQPSSMILHLLPVNMNIFGIFGAWILMFYTSGTWSKYTCFFMSFVQGQDIYPNTAQTRHWG